MHLLLFSIIIKPSIHSYNLITILNNIKIKCPEIKFADSRIDNIQGRIINPISSIITIKFIKNTGEFNGTEWLRNMM